MELVRIETERLILREFTQDDMEPFFKIYSDEKITRFLPWYPVKSMQEALDFFEERYVHSNDYKYAICLKENNVPIGYVNVCMDDSHDFGYGLLEEYWRQGIVSEAGRAVIE